MAVIDQDTVRNQVLTALPAPEFALIASRLSRMHLTIGEVINRAGDHIDHLYFVESGFISAMAVLSDGQPLEIGLIGNEGVAGANVVLGAANSYSETMCQTGGDALRIPVSDFLVALARAPRLRDNMLRYINVFGIQVAQTAACNAHHDLGQRLARWLLAAHDRTNRSELALTQDLIAVMLGVRRSTVSIAAGMLQKAGVIRYHHGRITIIDRPGLEIASCECYGVVAREYRLMLLTPSPDIDDAGLASIEST